MWDLVWGENVYAPLSSSETPNRGPFARAYTGTTVRRSLTCLPGCFSLTGSVSNARQTSSVQVLEAVRPWTPDVQYGNSRPLSAHPVSYEVTAPNDTFPHPLIMSSSQSSDVQGNPLRSVMLHNFCYTLPTNVLAPRPRNPAQPLRMFQSNPR